MINSDRLAPPHSHYFEISTLITLGHRHSLQVFVFAVNGNSADGHTHTFTSITSTNDGHLHQTKGVTGPAIPRQDGSHYHEIQGETSNQPYIHKGDRIIPVSYPIHFHVYQGATGGAIGYEPNWF